MISFHAGLKVFLAIEPMDMRMGFNGLWAAASQHLKEDPRQGALFVFSNRTHSRLKILYFDGTGICLLAKCLEKGTFYWPQSADPNVGEKIQLSPQALQLLIDGIELKYAGRRAWYER